MDAVFVNPSPGGKGINEATIEPPLGLACLAAVLEQEGCSCRIIDANALRLDPDEVMAQIPPDTKLIGFYSNSFVLGSVRELCLRCAQERGQATLIVGGPLASAAPEIVLDKCACHGVIMGEGEEAVVRMMKNLAAGRPAFDPQVSGAAWRDPDTGEMQRNAVVRIEDIDRLPFPAYHLLPPLKAYKSRSRKRPVAAIVTSRGCAYECIFCSKNVFQRRVTFRSADNVLAEVDHLVRDFGVRQIDILDDNFAQKKSRMVEILDGLIERDYGLAINPQNGIRSEIIDEPLLEKMKRAGFYKLAFGVESADPDVLRTCRKRLDLDRLEQVVTMAKKMGFVVYGFFIIGLPGETEEAFQRTLDFVRRVDFDVANFCMAVPFVGTELYNMIESDGRFLVDTTDQIDAGFYHGEVFCEYGQERAEDILRRYKTAYRKFYTFGKKLRLLTQIRSWSELRWHVEVAALVLKGTLRSALPGLGRREG